MSFMHSKRNKPLFRKFVQFPVGAILRLPKTRQERGLKASLVVLSLIL